MDRAVTFDCYGTLIDFDLEGATRRILGPRLQLDGVVEAEFLRDFRVMRYQAVLESYRPYREILHRSLDHATRLHGIPYDERDGDQLVEAITGFSPFPEVPAALRRVREQYPIVIVSNSDDDLIAHNVRAIGVEFDAVITAEQAGAYKPTPSVFRHTLRSLGLRPDQTVHVAQGFEYDIMPTLGMGMRRIWVNRYGLRGSSMFMPYEEIPDLAPLPDLLGVGSADERQQLAEA